MSKLKDQKAYDLADPSSGPPPKSHLFGPGGALAPANLIDTVRFSLALGFGWAVMFLIISIVKALAGGNLLDFASQIYPNFYVSVPIALIIGLIISFLYAFIFGVLVGVFFNKLVKKI